VIIIRRGTKGCLTRAPRPSIRLPVHLPIGLRSTSNKTVLGFHEIPYKGSLQKFVDEAWFSWKSAQCSIIFFKGVNKFLPCCYVSWLVLVKFGTENLPPPPWSILEFCENQYSERYVLFRWRKRNFPRILYTFGGYESNSLQNMPTKIYWVILSLVILKYIFLLGGGRQKNFSPPCSHLLSNLDEIHHKRSARSFVEYLWVSRKRAQRSPCSLIGVNKITFRRVPWNTVLMRNFRNSW